jgi:putative sporulation protein YyaC
VDNVQSSEVCGTSGEFPVFRVSFDDDGAVEKLSGAMDSLLESAGRREVVIVCVGTDRSTGDSFGPIIGSKLYPVVGAKIYGTLDEPVHAVNLAATLEYIAKSHKENPFIIAVDACLGKFDHVGQIIVERGPLRPGAGVKKTLPEFGDFTVTGVVNVSGFMEYFVLQNTRLGIVMKMTDIVVKATRNGLFRRNMRLGISQAMRS